eukprot:comp24125_c0_seq1/m.43768 comp24125_c0_seq1/g.43768  ORF comp24125_c0_seq1/g.43768 comp24125_c0_seq1/m.43768 type:complete len:461 (-) comp24125_c0_seq1:210-1592(-)
MNHNVALTNIFTFFDGLAMGMWNYAILGPYLFALCKDNKHAGYAEGVQGTLQALAAIPAGLLADKYRRDTVLKGSAAIGLVGMVVTLAGLYQFFNNWYENYLLLTAGLGIFGLYMGAWSPPMYAIYADSVASGQRSKYEMYRYILSIASLASGPITNVVLFAYMGDDWGMPQMTVIFAVGISLHIISIGSLAFFNDDKTAKEQSKAICEDTNSEAEEDAAILRRLEAAEKRKGGCFSWLHVSMVPAIVATSDIVFGLASGMTIKFFPIYFAEKLHLSPITVNILFVLDPFTEVCFSLIAQRLSLKVGRVEVTLAFKAIGVALLTAMALFPDYWEAQPYVLCAVYIIRSALINCVVPLTRSILMDYVASEKRGLWNSLESVAGFGWSGSAVVGGLIVDLYGYEASFGFTAFIQFLAWTPLLLLLPLVMHEDVLVARDDVAAPLLGEKVAGHDEKSYTDVAA